MVGALALVLALVAIPPEVATAGDHFSVEVSLQRNELRRERQGIQRELKEIRRDIGRREEGVTVSGSASRARMFYNLYRRELRDSRRRERSLLEREETLEHEFRRLTQEVRAHYGTVPVWWGSLE